MLAMIQRIARGRVTEGDEVLAECPGKGLLILLGVTTEDGEVTLSGEGLHVTRLMLEEGQLTVEGHIDSVFYSQRARGRGLFRRAGK